LLLASPFQQLIFSQTGEASCGFDPEYSYQLALSCREPILQLGDTRSLTYLMLLGQYVSEATSYKLNAG
jgi:hypothetical protein